MDINMVHLLLLRTESFYGRNLEGIVSKYYIKSYVIVEMRGH